MPRKKAQAHLYGVFVTCYASAEIKERIEAGTERISRSEQLTTQSFYFGTSKARAEQIFARAAIAAYNNPLAFQVALDRDGTVLARMRVERR
jgi:hypothetical protein